MLHGGRERAHPSIGGLPSDGWRGGQGHRLVYPAGVMPLARPSEVALAALATLAASLGLACASFDRISYDRMAPRLAYQGFSFDKPPNEHWYILESEQSYTSVPVRRELDPPSPTHSFYAAVALGGIEREPRSHADFAALARSKGRTGPYEITEVSYHQETTTRQGQWCIRSESVDRVRGAPVAPDRTLTMVIRGFRCLHPTWPKTTLDFFYSERGLPEELDPALYEEGEAFLRGVRIDVAPDTPAE